MMSQNLKESYELIKDELIWDSLKWKIYKQIYGRDEETVELINEIAPGCFKIFQDALLNDVIMTLARLVDKSSTSNTKNLTLSRLLEIIQQEGNDEILIVRLKEKYKKIEEMTTVIKAERNKRIGHNDLKSIRSNFVNLVSVSRSNINEIFDDIYDFMNTILSHFEGADQLYELFGLGDDGDMLINHLQKLKRFYETE